jgi:acyl-CoA synthetase (AMP-forming)/AMP-acid ligase II
VRPQTMLGYWNRPAESAKALRGGPLHTGDIGHFDADGYLYLVDRLKDMIVTRGGQMFMPPKSRKSSTTCPKSRSAPSSDCRTDCGAKRSLPSSYTRTSRSARPHCCQRLAGYRVPKRIIWVDALPRNAYGKVLKARPRERFGIIP